MEQLSEDLREKIDQIVNKERVAVIGFVAPQDAVRISPISFASASIDEADMYKLGEIIREIKSVRNPPTTLHLIIQTPGGELFTSYKIAHYLRSSFEKIKVYIPYQAASGGTLLCCAANEIYLGELGNLTPIDPQIRYGNTRISAYAFERTVETIQKLFGEYMPEEVPTPWQQLTNKIDPVIYDEMQTVVFTTFLYARKLLKKSGYDEDTALKIAFKLSKPHVTHAHPFLFDDAKEMGLNVCEKDDNIEIYSAYVSARLKAKSTNHIIDHFYAKPTNTEGTPNPGTKLLPIENNGSSQST